MRLSLQVKNKLNKERENTRIVVKEMTVTNTKRKYKSYQEIINEIKNIKPPMFNGEMVKCAKAEAWISDELKEKMAI